MCIPVTVHPFAIAHVKKPISGLDVRPHPEARSPDWEGDFSRSPALEFGAGPGMRALYRSDQEV
ncbi:MAG: hypothetical protein AAF609_09465 [Cyanobacteria bacterium P01_C01_bin.120]